jgi:ornithine carbamoyltransferase
VQRKDLISIADLSGEEVADFLRLAAEVKANPGGYRQTLAGQILALVFEKPSLRTRVSFEAGMLQLGGHAITLAPSDISMGSRESVPDVARNLSRFTQGIMARTFAHATVTSLAEHASVPVINGLTDLLHPCQALADMQTLAAARGQLAGCKLAFVGDGNNVCHSLINAGAKLGVSIAAVVPAGYEPLPEIVQAASVEARSRGASITVTHSLEEGLAGADAVYTDVWASMGQEAEAVARQKIFAPYQVNARAFSLAKPDAIFLHCLPAHRGEEVTAEVCDGPRSLIFEQAENRLHAQKAVLIRLMGGRGAA